MISRRNIRIKVLQSLYTLLNVSEGKNIIEAKKYLNAYYNQATHFTIANLLLAKNICEYCIIDSNQRSAKHLATPEDLNVSIKPAQNKLVTDFIENTSFNKAIENAKLNGRWNDNDAIKNIYTQINKTSEYLEYIKSNTKNTEEDIQFFSFVLQFLSTNEDAQTLLQDLFIAFDDDKVTVDGWIISNYKQIADINFLDLLSTEKSSYGLELIETFIDKYDITFDLIQPKLINWEADRIAMIDLIILQLGVTELLYFPTIPAKVSINEYIDIAKAYSTMQSGQFVNGVLDKIHKDLLKENKLNKIDRPFKNK